MLNAFSFFEMNAAASFKTENSDQINKKRNSMVPIFH